MIFSTLTWPWPTKTTWTGSRWTSMPTDYIGKRPFCLKVTVQTTPMHTHMHSIWSLKWLVTINSLLKHMTETPVMLDKTHNVSLRRWGCWEERSAQKTWYKFLFWLRNSSWSSDAPQTMLPTQRITGVITWPQPKATCEYNCELSLVQERPISPSPQ